ncbi:hypothetical protein G3N95_02765 [Paraburkholderia sp. Tr-20389]|uniref:hypothetical protein n=1 Tax=Paraburkholderia sp. Tr-20389 TaxID=2703903 RepID=UPI00197CDF65|nr:hypothetical protein [Paraburkholderia sp. Tr-20389]MBN3751847.1 hypothetical protein [Paraburkholderia sp. Tr-20389]
MRLVTPSLDGSFFVTNIKNFRHGERIAVTGSMSEISEAPLLAAGFDGATVHAGVFVLSEYSNGPGGLIHSQYEAPFRRHRFANGSKPTGSRPSRPSPNISNGRPASTGHPAGYEVNQPLE